MLQLPNSSGNHLGDRIQLISVCLEREAPVQSNPMKKFLDGHLPTGLQQQAPVMPMPEPTIHAIPISASDEYQPEYHEGGHQQHLAGEFRLAVWTDPPFIPRYHRHP